ncbi:glycerol-3-phosphate dehydrogenase [Mumia flava]|uniref:Glycerol-3-phosphate dehydrogenase n=2 Tax=Mumia flava TaxID=1348852 RepID=A0A0B2BK19_9ACTN|nr:glycerol-3-phosphate dehydrogenase [Mumia flava]
MSHRRNGPDGRAAGIRAGSSLSAARRAADLDALRRRPAVDLIVVGGGVTGTGVALDAASRGLRVVLAERHDLAWGTSRWSSKLVHGGLRYLASGDVRVAHESAVERGILMERTAPHLIRPLTQTIPLTAEIDARQAALLRAGTLAGDGLRLAAWTGRRRLARSRRVGPDAVVALAPTVRTGDLRGGLVHTDGQLVDDARLVVALARTAASYGARILTRTSAVEVGGRGARLRDELSGDVIDLDARVVVNASGVWAGAIDPTIVLRPSRGSHLVLPQRVFGGLRTALTVPVPGARGRFVFALPAPEGRVIVGLTDVDAPGPVPDDPQASAEEVTFLLSTMSRALRTSLEPSDLIGTYAGLRPLLDVGAGATADLSRRHAVVTRGDGLVSVVGGKLTTYRRMAQDAVDAALLSAGLAAGPCRTRSLPLVGAAAPQALARVAAPARLVRRYGTEATAVLATGADGSAPVAHGTGVTAAELRFAVRHEGALEVDDLLDRRTRIGLDPDARTRALDAARVALADG